MGTYHHRIYYNRKRIVRPRNWLPGKCPLLLDNCLHPRTVLRIVANRVLRVRGLKNGGFGGHSPAHVTPRNADVTSYFDAGSEQNLTSLDPSKTLASVASWTWRLCCCLRPHVAADYVRVCVCVGVFVCVMGGGC